jgi:hypothetical protein
MISIIVDIYGVRMLKSFSDSHLLPTQVVRSPLLDEVKSMPPSGKKRSNLEIIKVYAPIITALIAMFSALVVAGMQKQSATNKQLNDVVTQVNSKIIDILEEQMQDLKDKNEELEDKLNTLTENNQDMRRILASKFGTGVGMPVQRLKPPNMRLEPERVQMHKLTIPER